MTCLKERLNLAHDKQERFKEEIEQQRANSAKLEREIDELKTELAKVKAQVPSAAFLRLDKQLDKVASAGAVVANTVTVLSTANNELGRTLTFSGGKYEARGSLQSLKLRQSLSNLMWKVIDQLAF